MQKALHLILLVEPRRWLGRFGPEIRDGVQAAELQANEMVDLVPAAAMRCDPVLACNSGFLLEETFRTRA